MCIKAIIGLRQGGDALRRPVRCLTRSKETMALGLALIISLLSTSVLAEVEGHGGTCGVQYEPNNVMTTVLNEVNFDTNPFLYSIFGGFDAGAGFSAVIPFIFAEVNGSVISTTSDRPAIIVSEQGYDLVDGGAIQVKARFSFRSDLVSGVVNSPLGYNEDPFYSAGIFGLARQDPDRREMYFVITNNKVYAYLSYTNSNNLSARYLIPVADKTVDTVYTYSVTLSSDYALSFRIDDKEVLRIFPLGRPIDPRFDIGINSGQAADPNLVVPNPVNMIFGLTKLEFTNVQDPDVVPRTACQRTLFKQCRQNLRNAFGSNCQYADPSVYSSGNPIFAMEMDFEEISGVSYMIDGGCPVIPGCAPKPVTCPQVKPERRRKPRNPFPITSTVTAQPKPVQTQPAPRPAACGCGAL